jgi:transcription elongation factor GreA
MERLRIWWAETDAPEETEDAILDAIAASVEAGSRDRHGGRVLPWANLEAVTGERRDTGITGALRADVGAEVGAGATGSVGGSEGQRQVRTIAGPRPSAAPRAAAGAPRAAAARVRGSRAAGPCSPPPSVHLTAEGLAAATAELEELRNVRRPEVIQRVKHARELGDLRENADYEAARNEQSFLEGRIRTLERLLKAAVVIDTAGDGKVALGSTVVVEVDGERQTLRIVGSAEADPVSGRISNVSPVGRQLLGRRPGEEVVIRTPGHEVHYRVIEVDGTAA